MLSLVNFFHEEGFMPNSRFATALCCMDGRACEAVTQWGKATFQVHHVDLITEPGMEALLEKGEREFLEWARRRAMISYEKHGSRVLIVAAHEDCAANILHHEERIMQVQRGVVNVFPWGFDRVSPVWVGDDLSIRPI